MGALVVTVANCCASAGVEITRTRSAAPSRTSGSPGSPSHIISKFAVLVTLAAHCANSASRPLVLCRVRVTDGGCLATAFSTYNFGRDTRVDGCHCRGCCIGVRRAPSDTTRRDEAQRDRAETPRAPHNPCVWRRQQN